jgi:PAS domain S-box-containing protein
MLRHVLNAIPDLLTVHDQDFNTILSNWHGYESVPEAERQGRPKCYRVYHHREQPCDHCHAVEVMATGQPLKVTKVNSADGRVREVSAFPIRDESGRVVLVVEHLRDITELHRAAEALKESEGRFRTLIEDSPETLFLIDVQGTILAASRVTARRLGKNLEEVVGAALSDLFCPEVAARRRQFVEQAVATGRPVRFEDARDNFYFDNHINPLLDADGKVSRLSILGIDITDRKNAEQALKEKTRLNQILLDAFPCVALLLRPGTREIVAANAEAIKAGAVPGTKCFSTWGQRQDSCRWCLAPALWATGEAQHLEVESQGIFWDAQWIPVAEDLYMHFAFDITARKRTEAELHKKHLELQETAQQLEQSRNMLQLILESIPVRVFWKDSDLRYLGCNTLFARDAGFNDPQQLLGQDDFAMGWREQADLYSMDDRQVIESRRPKMNFVEPQTTPAGGKIWLKTSKVPLPMPNGEAFGVLGVYEDVTERQLAEEALAEQRELMDYVIRHDPNAIAVYDHELRYVFVSERYLNDYGIQGKDIIGKHHYEVFPEMPQHWKEVHQRVLAGEVERSDDDYFERPDGSITYNRWECRPWYRAGGRIGGIITYTEVTTARKQAEVALRESEARFRHISSTISDISYSCKSGPDGSYGIDWLAGAVEHITGYSVEEIKARGCWKFLVIEGDQPLFEQHITGLVAGASGVCELRLRHKNGGIVWVASFAKIVPIPEQPRTFSIYGGLVDITARKQAEEALRESERQKSIRNEILQIFLTFPDKDMYDAVLQVILKAMESQFGVFAYKDEHGALVAPSMTRDIWEQCNIPDKTIRFPPETWGDTIWARAIRQKRSLGKNEPGLVPEGHVPIENVMVVPLLYRDEVFAHFEVANKKGGYSESDKDWLEGIAQFIAPVLHARLERDRKEAARQQAEEALAAHLEFLRLLLDTIPNPIFFKDAQGAYLGCNKAFEDFLGVTRQEIVGKSVYDLSPRELADEYHRMDLAAFEATGTQVYESQVQAADGARRHVVFHKATFPDPAGDVGGLVGIITDITDLKQAEAELRQSEQRFRLMAETIQDVFWIASPGMSKTVYVSPGFEYIWGRTRDTLYRNPKLFLETVHPEDQRRVKAEIITAREGSIPWDHEYRIIRPDGTVRWIHNRGFPVRDDQGRVTLFTGVATDVTERKVLEGQLLQAQKMEAVGRLAGGVAHDFNNLLMAITGYGELMRAKVLKDDPLYGHLENILKAGERAAALTQQLLTFSRQQVVHPEVIDLNRVVRDLEPMLRRLIGEDLDLEVVTDRKPAAVKADPGQMGQIIMNLVVNARDAMPQGGRLTLKTTPAEFKESRNTRFGLAPPGAYVMLAAQDTGVGMDEATQAHIFEPFFTTKEPGKGTGLGLSTVYGIVKQSGGFLDLVSEPGAGSTFTIYLPRQEASVEPLRAKPPITASFQGQETVLLVEDEDMLRGLLAKFLQLYGYTVLEARHGGEALLACERHPGPIHVMVTDVVMPQMSGRELADRLTPLRPEMKILYMSGYTEDALVQHGVADLSVTFLQKPFRPIELARRVHAILHPPVSR